MKSLLLFLATLICAQVAFAQSDSTYLDVGRLRLQKAFTQSTTIKAADIARMPFINLSEVIRSWANGALTQKDQMVYVVDGITVADIDAYNIQDIEDITIVRNALVNQNGAGNMQLMALVRTKQWTEGTPHFSFSAMGSAISRKVITQLNSREKESQQVFAGNFQQYVVTARGGNQTFHYGGSLGFIHDALPGRNKKDSLYDTKIPGINRLKVNLWGQVVINSHNVLSAYFNYVPQTERGDVRSITTNYNTKTITKNKEYLLNPYIKLETTIANWLVNKFTFSYLTGRIMDSIYGRNELLYDGRIRNDRIRDSLRAESFTFNDNFSVRKKLGSWLFEPSLNINFQKAYYRHASMLSSVYEQVIYGSSYSWSWEQRQGKQLTATPSLSVSYGSLFLIQGGILQDISKIVDSRYPNTRSYPFANATVNLSQLMNATSKADWKLFGSYSERFSVYDGVYQLSDFNHTYVLPASLEATPYVIGYPSIIPPPYKAATQWQAGTGLSLFEKKLRINYNYLNAEQRLLTVMELPIASSSPVFITAIGKYLRRQHYVSIEGDIVRRNNFTWTSGLYFNNINNRSRYDNLNVNDPHNYKDHLSTGGFVNRIQCKKFYAGLDLVYLLNFNERTTIDYQPTVIKHNVLQVANIFVAYQFNCWRFNHAEFFINGRNLVDSDTYPISTDYRKYFGGGFNVSL
jgi:hypothetical protein